MKMYSEEINNCSSRKKNSPFQPVYYIFFVLKKSLIASLLEGNRIILSLMGGNRGCQLPAEL